MMDKETMRKEFYDGFNTWKAKNPTGTEEQYALTFMRKYVHRSFYGAVKSAISKLVKEG